MPLRDMFCGYVFSKSGRKSWRLIRVFAQIDRSSQLGSTEGNGGTWE